MDSTAIHRRRWLILSVLIIGLTAIVLDNTVLNIGRGTQARRWLAVSGPQAVRHRW